MSGLPRGWVESSVDEVGDISSGFGFPDRFQGNVTGELPFAKVRDISQAYQRNGGILSGAGNYVSRADLTALKARTVPAGSVAFAKIGEALKLNRRVLLDVEAVLDNNCMAVTPHQGLVEPKFLYRFLTTLDFAPFSVATTVPSIRKGDVGSIRLPLPPLAEQKRVVAKLDALNAKSARARTELARIETLVSRYKQAVLSKAFSGELTESDRMHLSVPKERDAAPWHDGQEVQRKLKVRGATDVMDGIHLQLLPNGWNWVQNHSLAQNSANAICAGPFGTIFKAKDFRETGVPIIFLRHVGVGEYRTHKPGFMDEKVWRDFHQPYSVFGGELLVTKLGDPPGTACIYPANAGTAMVTPDVIKMSVDEKSSHPAFLMHYFNSPTAKSIIRELAFGLTRLRVDLAMFKTFPIPLPPLEEQHEIVRRIESAFAKIDRLAKEAKRALELVGRLDEAILAKAFRGELVPQDESDEPAEHLLARIRTEREAAPKGKRARGRASTAEKTARNRSASAMNKSRQDVEPNHLSRLLKSTGGRKRASELWLQSEMDIDEFYKQLRTEMDSGQIVEGPKKGELVLANEN